MVVVAHNSRNDVKLKAQARERAAADHARERFDARAARLERQKQEKRERLAAKKKALRERSAAKKKTPVPNEEVRR